MSALVLSFNDLRHLFIVFHKLNLTRISSLSQNLKFTQSMHDASKFKVLLPELFNYLSKIENFQSHSQNKIYLHHKYYNNLNESLRPPRPNFGLHLFLMGFHLEFSLFWVSWSFDISDLDNLRRGSGIFFQKSHFLNQCVPTKKMRYVTAFWSTISLNLSTDEVWNKKIGFNVYFFGSK